MVGLLLQANPRLACARGQTKSLDARLAWVGESARAHLQVGSVSLDGQQSEETSMVDVAAADIASQHKPDVAQIVRLFRDQECARSGPWSVVAVESLLLSGNFVDGAGQVTGRE
jgi:hypothetical protein